MGFMQPKVRSPLHPLDHEVQKMDLKLETYLST